MSDKSLFPWRLDHKTPPPPDFKPAEWMIAKRQGNTLAILHKQTGVMRKAPLRWMEVDDGA